MKRGSQTLSLEVFVALAVVAIMVLFMFAYIDSQTNTTGYFQRFYAKDLSLMAEITSASPGNIVVTYDNLRKEPFSYTLQKGVFSVSINDLAKTWGYGVYPALTVNPTTIVQPAFLTFIKSGNRFFLNEHVGYAQGCSLAQKTFSAKPVIYSDAFPVLSAGAREVYPRSAEIPTFDPRTKESNMVFVVDSRTGSNGAFIKVPAGDEYAYIGCLLENQIRSLSPGDVELSTGGENISIIIQKTDEWLDERLLGQIIGRTVIQYDRQ